MTNPDLNLANLRVLVTGAGHSIGFGIAQHFLASGAQVTLHTRASAVEGDLGEFRERAHFATGDFTQESDVEKVVAEAASAMGGLDVVVANVGGLLARVPLTEMTGEHWQNVMNVNVTSTFLTMKHSHSHLVTSNAGAIVTLASLAAHNGGGAGAAAYAASKAAVVGLTKGAAKEFAADGIRVNAVAPGFIGETRFHDTFSSEAAQESMIANTALRRAGTVNDVAALVGFLSSSASSFITGETVDINGGQWFR
ncbi:SDR family NAD(P)-dependent oxidoreductase [Microbacterium sp. YY-01]|uniref:SDR family NAD(P)-dependent oxidoreductase n=1 Tax=Microbacterium sp. YY-01 TaxID=3421634 RepID=UPI003D18393A